MGRRGPMAIPRGSYSCRGVGPPVRGLAPLVCVLLSGARPWGWLPGVARSAAVPLPSSGVAMGFWVSGLRRTVGLSMAQGLSLFLSTSEVSVSTVWLRRCLRKTGPTVSRLRYTPPIHQADNLLGVVAERSVYRSTEVRRDTVPVS